MHVATLRPAVGREIEQILRFYKRLNNEYVVLRPLNDLEAAAANGLFFIVKVDDEIRAVAGAFDFGPTALVELDGTLVDEPLRGFGLQRLLFRLRVAAVILNQGTAAQMFIAVDPTNAASRSNAQNCGFDDWTPPDEAVFESCSTCHRRENAAAMGRRCCFDYLGISIEKARQQVGKLLKESGEPPNLTLTNKRTGAQLSLIIRSNVIVEHRALLEEFVSGASW